MRDPKTRAQTCDALGLAGLGLLGAASHAAAQAAGLEGGTAGAAASALLGLGLAHYLGRHARAPETALPWAAGAAGLALGGLLAQSIGAWPCAAAGLALGTAGALLGRGGAPRESGPSALVWAAAFASLTAWARCLELLGGPAVPAWAWSAAALSLGTAAALALPRAPAGAETAGCLTLVSGLAGLSLLHLTRVLGLNSAAPVRLQLPVASAADLLFLPGQALLGLGVSAAFLAAAELGRPRRSAGEALGGLSAAAGAGLGWALLAAFGASRGAEACALLAAAAGLAEARRGLSRRAVALGAAATVLLAAGLRDPFRDLWLARLDSLSPGGAFTVFKESASTALGVYAFSGGQTVVLRDGMIPIAAPLQAKRTAHLALMAAPGPGAVLAAGAPHPETLAAAAAHGRPLSVLMPRLERDVLLGAAKVEAAWEGASPSALAGRGKAFSLILLAPPYPLDGPEARILVSSAALTAFAGRLAPGGKLAVAVPSPYRAGPFDALARQLAARFPRVGVLASGETWILLAGDAPPPGPEEMAVKLPAAARADEPSFAPELAGGRLKWTEPVPTATAPGDPAPGTPLGEILRRRPLLLGPTVEK